jgi:hypothetical protein
MKLLIMQFSPTSRQPQTRFEKKNVPARPVKTVATFIAIYYSEAK